MTTEPRAVLCGQCHRMVLVAVSDLHPPCFRNVEEQADCPEIRERRGASEEPPLMMMCTALARSLAEELDRLEVAAVDHGGAWQVACHVPGGADMIYAPGQARGQAAIWDHAGRAGLASRFRDAADEVERRTQRHPPRTGRPAPILALAVVGAVVAGTAGWWFLTRQPAPVAIRAPAAKAADAPTATKTASVAAPAIQPLAATRPASEIAVPVTTAQAMPAAEATASAAAPPPEPTAEPDMVSLPGGTFAMGSNLDPSEMPIHTVSIKPFAIGRFPVTVRAWKQCVTAKACFLAPTGEDDAPVSDLSFDDAQQFVAWLSQATHMRLRLPSEAEWEYAARGGTQTTYWWGDDLRQGMADCKGCTGSHDARHPAKVGDLEPNPFGLYAMGGGVAQWVADCWHKNYQGAVVDGSAWIEAGCVARVIRSGSWRNEPSDIRPASRDHYDGRVRYPTHGLRIARSL
ncbi:MAG: SUMF1/EgtB/PvdO family nonheme iron enzyme [Xanthobacteraceae bacterium]